MKVGFNMKYYSEHNNEYIENTKNADMSNLYEFFEKYLSKDSKKIMDLGFGSGRDSLYFKSKGYDVLAIDSTLEFCEYGKQIGLNVRCIKAEDLDYNNEFNGIWACASLLHVSSKDLNKVFNKCYKALKSDGIMYASFKYGSFNGIRDGRQFLDLNEELILNYIIDSGFKLIETKITFDVRPNRDDKWLNVILKKIR